MQAGTTTGQENDRHFVLDLLGLIARVIVAALAVNIVFGAFVLLLAGQAQAAAAPGNEPTRPCAVDRAALPHELKLAIVHRLGSPAPIALVRTY